MSDNIWPPEFTLDQERILNLLTGDRFYSNPSAALREAVLNAINAIQRRQGVSPALQPTISVTFDRDQGTISVCDNGTGMSQLEVNELFTKVGASAANTEANKRSVGEFGIGVISYFMAADSFELQSNDGSSLPVGLIFNKTMLAGGAATEVTSTQIVQGTTVSLNIRDAENFEMLLEKYPHWCRDVAGLSATLLPENEPVLQGDGKPPKVHWTCLTRVGSSDLT